MAAGRPKATIDWAKVDGYLRAHCDGMAIARLLGIHYNTLYETCKREKKCNFSEYSQQKKAEGITLMEASIYRDALTNGGVDRMFWLKNKAGWRDKMDVTSFNETTQTITVRTNEAAKQLEELKDKFDKE